MYKKLNAPDRIQAIVQAKRICRCYRESFKGVKWLDPQTKLWEEIGWLEIDRTRYPGRSKTSQTA
jgi:hypothetical protein